MPRVPEYFRGPLESSRTGVPSADHSGAIIASSVKNLADTFFQGISSVEAKAKRLVDNSTKAKAIGNYTTEYMDGADQIKKQFIDDPEMATKKLKEFRSELKNRHVEGLEDRGLQQEFALSLDTFNIQEDISDTAWKIKQSTQLAQQNYLSRISSDAMTLSRTNSYEEFIKKVEGFQNEESLNSNLSQAFGGLAEGQKVLDQGLEAMTRGFVTGMVSRGESFQAAQHLLRGDLDPFITSDTKADLLKRVEQAQTGDQRRSTFMQAAEAAIDIFQSSTDVFDNSLDLVGLEEKITDLSFTIGQAQLSNKSPDQINFMTKQLNLLERLRDVKVEEVSRVAKDDLDTKADLMSDYQFLVEYDEGKNGLLGTVEKTLEFQRKATEKFYEGKLSSTTYQKWMLFTKTAIQNDLTNALKDTREGGQTLQRGFAFGEDKLLSKSSSHVRSKMSDILKNSRLGKQHAVDTLEFYMDMVSDQLGGDLTDISQLTDETHNKILARAKTYATLKSMNLPVYLTVGDKVPVNGKAYDIVGFDKDGMPQVEVGK